MEKVSTPITFETSCWVSWNLEVCLGQILADFYRYEASSGTNSSSVGFDQYVLHGRFPNSFIMCTSNIETDGEIEIYYRTGGNQTDIKIFIAYV